VDDVMSEPLPTDFDWVGVAEQYRAKGWMNTLPLPAREKTPPPAGFTGRDGKTVLKEHLTLWSTDDAFISANLCIRLPQSVIGFDVDDYGNKHGGMTLKRLEKKLGVTLPSTWISTSRPGGTSGIRLYRIPLGLAWAWPEGEGAGIDLIRYDHRYLLCWPSIHPEGRQYFWISPEGIAHMGPLPVQIGALPEFPREFIDYLTSGRTKESDHIPGLRVGSDLIERAMNVLPAGDCAKVKTELVAALGSLSGEGTRHDSTLAAVLTLLNLGSAGHRGVPIALEALQIAFVGMVGKDRREAAAEYWRMLDQGKAGRELMAIAGTGGFAQPRSMPCSCDAPAEPDAPPVDYPDAPRSLRSFVLGRSGLANLPKQDPIIEGVLFHNTTHLLSGRKATFKSFITLDWCLSIATGKDWQGRAVEQMPVLYIVGEGAYGLDARVSAWESAWDIMARDFDLPVPDDQFMVIPIAVNLFRNSTWLGELVNEIVPNFGVVAIDTLRRASGGADGNSDKDMGIVVDSLERIKRASRGGCTLTVGHTQKADEDTRGSSVLEDDHDVVWRTKNEEGVITLTNSKMKDGPDGHVMELHTLAVGDSLVIESHNRGHAAAEISAAADKVLAVMRRDFSELGAQGITSIHEAMGNMSKSTCRRALNELASKGKVKVEGANVSQRYSLVPGA
jgi:hypothetical protein